MHPVGIKNTVLLPVVKGFGNQSPTRWKGNRRRVYEEVILRTWTYYFRTWLELTEEHHEEPEDSLCSS
jgi:hypothetical protein